MTPRRTARATAWVRFRARSSTIKVRRQCLTVRIEQRSSAAISALPRPSATRRSTLTSSNEPPCGDGAVGIDNIWHDDTSNGGELGSGTNPLWHAGNLKRNLLPRYAPSVGLTPDTDAADRLSGTYHRLNQALGNAGAYDASQGGQR